jgi:hypothetical protein
MKTCTHKKNDHQNKKSDETKISTRQMKKKLEKEKEKNLT